MKKVIFCGVLFSSCYSPKYAERYLDKLYQHNPLTFRKKADEYFPSNWVITQIPYDTARWKTYDSIYNRPGVQKKVP